MPRKPGDKFARNTECRNTFLRELASTGHIYHACKVAGISYQTMKHYREGGPKADRDQEFEADYLQAMGDYVGTLKAEAQRRALDGWEERPVLDKEGNIVGHVKKYSDTLLLALLKRSDDGYKERVQVDATTEHKGTVTHTHEAQGLEQMYKDMTPVEQEAWKTALRALARVEAQSTQEEKAPPKGELH